MRPQEGPKSVRGAIFGAYPRLPHMDGGLSVPETFGSVSDGRFGPAQHGKRSAGGAGPDRPLTLIHRNNSPKPATMRVSGLFGAVANEVLDALSRADSCARRGMVEKAAELRAYARAIAVAHGGVNGTT